MPSLFKGPGLIKRYSKKNDKVPAKTLSDKKFCAKQFLKNRVLLDNWNNEISLSQNVARVNLEDVVKDLPPADLSESTRTMRLPEKEAVCIRKMIARHGNDIGKMEKDAKLNPFLWRKTAIRRKVTLYNAKLLKEPLGSLEILEKYASENAVDPDLIETSKVSKTLREERTARMRSYILSRSDKYRELKAAKKLKYAEIKGLKDSFLENIISDAEYSGSGSEVDGDQSSGDQSSGDQSSGDQSSGDQSSGDQSSGDESTKDEEVPEN